MILENIRYYIGKLRTKCGFAECITIPKKTLEEWRDHYRKAAKRYKDNPNNAAILKWVFYAGKADVLTDILKHFDRE